MKILWKFDTDNPDEFMEMQRCLKANDAFNYIWDILHNSQKSIIHNIDQGKYESQEEVVYDIYRMMWDRLNERGINLEKLIE